MNWLIFFVISITVLVVSIIGAVVLYVHPEKTGKVITPFNILLVGTVLIVFISLLPVFGGRDNPMGVLSVILLALHNTFQVITINSDLQSILTDTGCPGYYSVLLALEFVIMPLFTVGFFVSLVKDITSYVRLFMHQFSDVYVFTELNERSLALGKSIKNDCIKALVVYTDIGISSNPDIDDLTERAKRFRAVCFKRDINSIRFGVCRSQLCFFAIGADEEQTIDCSISLIDRFRNRKNTRLYVFTTSKEAELVFESINPGEIVLRRVNEVTSLINRFLYESGVGLFRNAVPATGGNGKSINAVIIGLGRHGTELLKALVWFCQMDGYHLSIDAYDIDERKEDCLRAQTPELLSSEYNGVKIRGEAEYTINIHSGVDVTTKTFQDAFLQKRDTSFVFISLGADERNISTAVEIRMLCERMRIFPPIYSVVLSSMASKELKDIKNFKGQAYNIQFLGDISTSYSAEVIINSALEQDCIDTYAPKDGDSEGAKKKKQKRESDFWRFDYNYRSKMASVIHAKVRRELDVPGAVKEENERTQEETDVIKNLEHRRWNAYTRSIGYVFSGSTDENSRNDLGKTHNDLVNYYSLSEEEKNKDNRQ